MPAKKMKKAVKNTAQRNSSAKKSVSMKTSPRISSKETSTKGRPQSFERKFTGNDSTEQQTPLSSFDSHVEANREMGVSVAVHNPKKEPMNEKVKTQNKTAKNVSHSRSHSSQYRG